jgi:hypothetical protein
MESCHSSLVDRRVITLICHRASLRTTLITMQVTMEK